MEEEASSYTEDKILLGQFLSFFQSYYSRQQIPPNDGKVHSASSSQTQLPELKFPVINGTESQKALGDRFVNDLYLRFIRSLRGEKQEQQLFDSLDKVDASSDSKTTVSPLDNHKDKFNISDISENESHNVLSKWNISPPSKHSQHLQSLLQSFEVWSAKSLAHEVLLNKSPVESPASCSFLLNLPDSRTFTDLFPHIDLSGITPPKLDTAADNSKKNYTLPISVNSLTCREFTRLSLIVSLLPTRDKIEALYLSPLCDSSPSLPPPDGKFASLYYNERSAEAMLQAETSRCTPSDLVALWIRGQRNTYAMRHLVGIFEFQFSPDSDRYNARYVGSSKNTRKKVTDETPLIESLTNWAISNQVLVTSKLVRDDVSYKQLCRNVELENKESGLRQSKRMGAVKKRARNIKGKFQCEVKECDRDLPQTPIANLKRMRTSEVKQSGVTPSSPQDGSATLRRSGRSKRNRTESPVYSAFVTETPPPCPPTQKLVTEEKLPPTAKQLPKAPPLPKIIGSLNSRHTYLLRWFSRRHRNILSFIYSSHQVKSKEISMFIKTEYKPSTDRTLARVDRRITTKFIDEESFRDAVMNLLSVLKKAVEKDEVKAMQLKLAMMEFDVMYEKFIKSDKPLAVLRPDATSITSELEFSNLLLSHPVPWIDHCYRCKQSAAVDSTNKEERVNQCICCGIIVHEKCSGDFELKNSELPRLYDALLVYDSLVDMLPDAGKTKKEEISLEWEEKEIVLTRDYSTPSWGINLNYTEKMNISKLVILADTGDKDNAKPLPYVGFLSEEVRNGSRAKECGLQTDDIITHVEFCTSDDASKTPTAITRKRGSSSMSSDTPSIVEKHDLSKVTQEKRMNFFRKKFTRMKLSIRRPYWHKKARPLGPFQYCLSCRVGYEEENELSSDKRIFQDALHCRAVIRRLGMEWCSLPFHYEVEGLSKFNHTEDCTNQLDVDISENDMAEYYSNTADQNEEHNFVSMRRLDQMMSSIIATKGNNSGSPPSSSPHSDPFNEPPCSTIEHSGINGGCPCKQILKSTQRESSQEPPPKRVSWAPKGIENRPIELLLKGMRILYHRVQINKHSKNSPLRNEFLRKFLYIFHSWCLDTRMNIVKIPSASLMAMEPWVYEVCHVCLVHMCKGKTEEGIQLCNSAGCWENHYKKKSTEKEKVESISDNHLNESGMSAPSISAPPSLPEKMDMDIADNTEEHVPPVVDGKQSMDTEDDNSDQSNTLNPLSSYTTWSSLVGETLIILPGDPLITKISKDINASIDHNNRPLEMLIISFWPRFENGDNGMRFLEGMFYVFPVLGTRPLKFALSTCGAKVTEPNHWYNKSYVTGKGDDVSDHFMDIGVFHLEGVMKMTQEEVVKRLKGTYAIRSALDVAIARIAMTDEEEFLEEIEKSGAERGFYTEPTEGTTDGFTDRQLQKCRSVMSSFRVSEDGNTDILDRELYGMECIVKDSEEGGYLSLKPSVDKLVKDRISEYALTVDSLCAFGVKPVRDFLSNISKVSNNVTLKLHADTPPVVFEIGDETDIGDSDDDEPNMKVYPRKKDEGAFSEDGFSDEDDGMETAEPLEIPEGCLICYTDMNYTSGLPKLCMPNPFDFSKQSGTITVTVTNYERGKDTSNIPLSYSGKGWGLELVKWSNQKRILRVGRIYPNSPAHRSKLRPHDVIERINDKDVNSIGPDSALARLMLWSHSSSNAPEVMPNHKSAASFLLGKMKGTVIGPVTLKIRREAPRVCNTITHTAVQRPEVRPVTNMPHMPSRSQPVFQEAWKNPPQQNAAQQAVNYKTIAQTNRVPPTRPNVRTPPMKNVTQIPPHISMKNVTQIPPHISMKSVTQIPPHISTKNVTQIPAHISAIPVHQPYVHEVAAQAHKTSPAHLQWQQRASPTKVTGKIYTNNASHHDLAHRVANLAQASLSSAMSRQKTVSQPIDATNYKGHFPQASVQAHTNIPRPAKHHHTNYTRDDHSGTAETNRTPVADPTRPFLTSNHLYSSGVPSSVFTCVETIVMVEAVARGFSALGVRLLMPRYEAHVIQLDYQSLILPFQQINSNKIPRLQDDQWRAVLSADHKRSLKETGAPIFKENGFTYRVPTEILPLDRILEDVIFASMPCKKRVELFELAHLNLGRDPPHVGDVQFGGARISLVALQDVAALVEQKKLKMEQAMQNDSSATEISSPLGYGKERSKPNFYGQSNGRQCDALNPNPTQMTAADTDLIQNANASVAAPSLSVVDYSLSKKAGNQVDVLDPLPVPALPPHLCDKAATKTVANVVNHTATCTEKQNVPDPLLPSPAPLEKIVRCVPNEQSERNLETQPPLPGDAKCNTPTNVALMTKGTITEKSTASLYGSTTIQNRKDDKQQEQDNCKTASQPQTKPDKIVARCEIVDLTGFNSDDENGSEERKDVDSAHLSQKVSSCDNQNVPCPPSHAKAQDDSLHTGDLLLVKDPNGANVSPTNGTDSNPSRLSGPGHSNPSLANGTPDDKSVDMLSQNVTHSNITASLNDKELKCSEKSSMKAIDKPGIHPTSKDIDSSNLSASDAEGTKLSSTKGLIPSCDPPSPNPKCPSSSNPPEGDVSPNRIRGGGPQKLSEYPMTTWTGCNVFGRCMTSRNDKCNEEAILVGNVQGTAPPDKAMVTVFYVTNAGYLTNSVHQNIQACNLFIITRETKWYKIAQDWYRSRADNRGMNRPHPQQNQYRRPAPSVQHHQSHPKSHNQNPAPKASRNSGARRDISSPRPKSKEYIKARHGADKTGLSIKDCARLFVHRCCQKVNGPVPLGILPDGRAVFWLQQDPRSIYLRTNNFFYSSDSSSLAEDEAQRHYRIQIKRVMKNSERGTNPPSIVLSPCKNGMYCCLWGCSETETSPWRNTAKRRILSFPTRKELSEHVLQHHGLQSNTLDHSDVASDEMWVRIPEGHMIRYLCADLTAAICARCPHLGTSYTRDMAINGTEIENTNFFRFNSEKHLMFNYMKVLDLTVGGKGVPNFSSMQMTVNISNTTDVKCRSLLRLWSRLCRLFSVENDAIFRLNEIDCQTRISSNSLIGGGTGNVVHEADVQEEAEESEMDPINTRPQKKLIAGGETFTEIYQCEANNFCGKETELNGLNCKLCSGPNERILCLSPIEANSSVGPNDKLAQQPIGCTLYTEVCFQSISGSNNLKKAMNSLLPLRGRLDSVKMLLLRVACKVPASLHDKATSSRGQNAPQFCIWKESYINSWILFLVNSLNERMIMQSFITLLNSINSNKMPKWWKASRSGWIGSTVSLQSPTLSSLAMRIYVFDLALAETMSLSKASLREDEFNNKNKSLKKNKAGLHEDEFNNKNKSLKKNAQDTASEEKAGDAIEPDTPKRHIIADESLVSLERMSTKDRMKTILSWADRLDITPFPGVSNDECSICDSGGSLMCCEFCNNVIHTHCCNPPMKQLPEFDWVCGECINDINILHVDDCNKKP